jgi:hypothetical protein
LTVAFNTQRLQFVGHSGATLAARLDLPNGQLRFLWREQGCDGIESFIIPRGIPHEARNA